MNVLILPRTIVALEYKALRYPAQLLETKVVAVRLPEDSSFRLAFERALGTLDSAAGRLLGDEGLQDRGRVLTRRVDILEKASALEERAAERKQAADAQLRSDTDQAAKDKAQAELEHQRKAAALQEQVAAQTAAVERKAKARQQAEERAIASAAQAALAADRARVEQQESQIDQRVAARTAAPKAQLKQAAADAKAAAARKADADQLGLLVAAEKDSRTS